MSFYGISSSTVPICCHCGIPICQCVICKGHLVNRDDGGEYILCVMCAIEHSGVGDEFNKKISELEKDLDELRAENKKLKNEEWWSTAMRKDGRIDALEAENATLRAEVEGLRKNNVYPEICKDCKEGA